MTQDSPLASLDLFLSQYTELILVLQQEAQCARWGTPHAAFAESLRRSAEKRFAGELRGPDEV